MKSWWKRIFLVCLIALAFAVLFLVKKEVGSNEAELTEFHEPENDEETILSFDEDGNFTGSGYMAMSLHLEDGTLYDSWLVERDSSDFTASLMLEGVEGVYRDYVLVVMADFIQTEIEVNGELTRAYKFSIGDSNIEDVRFTIHDLPMDTYAVQIIAFVAPDYLDISYETEEESNKMLDMSFPIGGQINFAVEETPVVEDYTGGVPSTYDFSPSIVNIYESKEEPRILPQVEGGTKATLCVGTSMEKGIRIAYVAFLGWEQVELVPGYSVLYETFNSDEGICIDFEFPDVDEPQPFQCVSFDYAFQEPDGYPTPEGSDRSCVNPSSN